MSESGAKDQQASATGSAQDVVSQGLSAPRSGLRVLCCGNPFAGDDAVGLLAVPLLRERLGDSVEVIEAGTPGLTLLDMMRGADHCVIVDCMVGGGQPGEVRCLTIDELATLDASFSNAHGVGIAEALALGVAVEPDSLPKRITIVAVEAASVKPFTQGLSEPVQQALPKLVQAVVNALGTGEEEACA
ncbi:MAG: hydrogenase maturation protease [Armatimonadota bacterium]